MFFCPNNYDTQRQIYDEILDWVKRLYRRQLDVEEASAIKKINNLSRDQYSLTSCVSALRAVAKFLSHISSVVRNYAAEILCELIKQTTKYLLSETNPKLAREVCEELLEIIDDLQEMDKKGLINLSIGNSLKLIDLKTIIMKTLTDLYEPLNKKHYFKEDKFIARSELNYFPPD